MGRQRDDVLERLRKKIVTHELNPGDIFSENIIAEELGVSRTPVREAIAILVHEGLVEQIPQVGAAVKELTEGDVAELLKLRRAIEMLVVDELLDHRDELSESTVHEALEGMEKAAEQGDKPLMLEYDSEYHCRLAETSGFLLAARILRSLRDKMRIIFGVELIQDDADVAGIMQEHRRIYEALLSNNAAEARQEMDKHLSRAEVRMGIATDGSGYFHEEGESASNKYDSVLRPLNQLIDGPVRMQPEE